MEEKEGEPDFNGRGYFLSNVIVGLLATVLPTIQTTKSQLETP
jgi:uncharacterized membrane protein YiaA